MLVGYHRNVSIASSGVRSARIGPAGHSASRRLGDPQRRACLGGERAADRPAFHPGGQFRLTPQR
jgi:hypothetical protein